MLHTKHLFLFIYHNDSNLSAGSRRFIVVGGELQPAFAQDNRQGNRGLIRIVSGSFLVDRDMGADGEMSRGGNEMGTGNLGNLFGKFS